MRMLFTEATQQMEEAKTNIVHLDDVTMANMSLLIQFCLSREPPVDLLAELSEDRVFECISIAHRYEFTFALKNIVDRLIQLIPIPTSSQLQFADRLELSPVLKQWSANCESMKYYDQFVRSLAECPVSDTTIALFSDVHVKHITYLEEVGI